VPTTAELGQPKLLSVDLVRAARAEGHAAGGRARMNAVSNEILADPAVKKRLAEMGAATLGGTPQQLAKHLAAETEKWARCARREDRGAMSGAATVARAGRRAARRGSAMTQASRAARERASPTSSRSCSARRRAGRRRSSTTASRSLDVAIIGRRHDRLACAAALCQRGMLGRRLRRGAGRPRRPLGDDGADGDAAQPRSSSPGPALGIPSLTFRAWFEAQFGRATLGRARQDPAPAVDGLPALVPAACCAAGAQTAIA
jgi:hypothetical protein